MYFSIVKTKQTKQKTSHVKRGLSATTTIGKKGFPSL